MEFEERQVVVDRDHLFPEDHAAVGGEAAVVAGRPSMDMLTIDVTGLARVAVGDRVELWGREVPVERVAAAAGTIAYELTCRVGRRVNFATRDA